MEATSGTAARHRYEVLDSLRGFCACMVVLHHFHTTGWISGLPIFRNSFLFVDFFFVLSGFVIASSYRRRIAEHFPIGRFMGLRLGRVYPLHLFMAGLLVLVQLALLVQAPARAFRGGMSLPNLLASLTLMQSFVLPNQSVWNGPSWSIAVEVWIYLLFAFVFRLFHRRGLLVAACLLIAIVSCAFIAATEPRFIEAYHWGSFFRCAYGFPLGVIGAELLTGDRKRYPARSVSATLIEIAAVAATITFCSLVGSGPFSLLAPPLFLAVILVFVREAGALSAGLKMGFPLLLGRLSYSIYMVHMFVLFRTDTLLEAVEHNLHRRLDIICETTYSCSAQGSPLLADALILPVFAAVIGASLFTYRFIERPCQDWSKRLLLGPRRGGQQAAEEQEAPAF